MAILKCFRFGFVLPLVMMLLKIHSVVCYLQYKVGDLDAWGLPSSENSQIYMYWSKYHSLKIGDSLMFLYPPSQDSVIQVTKESYNSCNLKEPILYMKDGNSVFNITDYGDLFFTSGVAGHCEKNQKLHISVLSGNGSSSSATAPSSLPEISPSYPTVFGGIPAAPIANSSSSSSSSWLTKSHLLPPVFIAALVILIA